MTLQNSPAPDTALPPASETRPTTVVSFATGEARAAERPVAAEAAVAVAYGGVPFAVMMATPTDLEDFAVGFSLTEGVVDAAAEIRSVRVEAGADGLTLAVDLVPGRLQAHLARRRTLAGRTGCGVCGIDDLKAVRRAEAAPPGEPARIAPEAVRQALEAIGEGQALNRLTGAVHAAAFCDPAGAILALREDAGRHNALDKLVGATLRAGRDPLAGFVLVTSRCSFEMVEKTARLGARTLVAISAPTALALDRARDLGLAVAGIARRDAMTVFVGAERFGLSAPAERRPEGPPPG